MGEMRILWLFCVLLAGACAAPEPPPEEPTPNPLHAELQAALEGFDAKSPGTLLAVRAPELDTFFGAAGSSDVDAEIAMTPQVLFGIASLTKSFTAAVVLALRDEGALTLDEPLGAYCAACPFGDKTVEQLLRHRSGLSDVIRELFATDLAALADPWAIDDLLALADDTGETDFFYSNTNYLLLGLLIEAVTHDSWEAEVRRRLLDPLELHETYLPTVDDVPPLAGGYFPLNESTLVDLRSFIHPSVGWSAGSMVSSASDVLRWMRLLTKGDAVAPTVLASMIESDGSYGRGLYVNDSALGPKIGHDGLSVFTSEAYCVPEADACVVAMANQYEADASGVADLAWSMLAR